MTSDSFAGQVVGATGTAPVARAFFPGASFPSAPGCRVRCNPRRLLHPPFPWGFLPGWEDNMARINLDSWSQQNRLQNNRNQQSKRSDRRIIPQLEVLEARVVPTTVILTPSKDNTLYESTTGDTSNGAGANFFVGVTNKASIRRGVIEFNIAGNIPAGATINSVSLSLHVSQTQAGAETIELHRLLADWGESTSNADGSGGGGRGAPAASNDATWLFRFFNTSRWTNAGGDFTSTISASASVGGVGSYTWG